MRGNEMWFVTGPSTILSAGVEMWFVTGPSTILSAGVEMCTFRNGNFTGCGSEKVTVCYIFRAWIRAVSYWGRAVCPYCETAAQFSTHGSHRSSDMPHTLNKRLYWNPQNRVLLPWSEANMQLPHNQTSRFPALQLYCLYFQTVSCVIKIEFLLPCSQFMLSNGALWCQTSRFTVLQAVYAVKYCIVMSSIEFYCLAGSLCCQIVHYDIKHRVLLSCIQFMLSNSALWCQTLCLSALQAVYAVK